MGGSVPSPSALSLLCYPASMRAVLGFVLALLFAVHTAYAASPRPPDCCEGCGDIHCVIASCICQPLALPSLPSAQLLSVPAALAPTASSVMLATRIKDIWRPPWEIAATRLFSHFDQGST